MKKILGILLFTFCISTSFAQTQFEMNNEAFNNYKKVDNELGVVYNLILKKYAKNIKFINALRASERLWIQFRDAEVKMMFPSDNPGFTYGSMYPLLSYGYLTELTRIRLKQLKIWVNPKQQDMQGSVGDYNGDY